METLWTFRTRHFAVSLAWEYEPYPDLSWADSETTAKLESGEWVNCCFRVQVTGPQGEILAAEYLGESIYEDPADFRKAGDYFSTMVREAIREARKMWNARPQVTLRAA